MREVYSVYIIRKARVISEDLVRRIEKAIDTGKLPRKYQPLVRNPYVFVPLVLHAIESRMRGRQHLNSKILYVYYNGWNYKLVVDVLVQAGLLKKRKQLNRSKVSHVAYYMSPAFKDLLRMHGFYPYWEIRQ